MGKFKMNGLLKKMNGLEIYIFLIIASCLIYYFFVQNRVTDRYGGEAAANIRSDSMKDPSAPGDVTSTPESGRTTDGSAFGRTTMYGGDGDGSAFGRTTMYGGDGDGSPGSVGKCTVACKYWGEDLMMLENEAHTPATLPRRVAQWRNYAKYCGCHMVDNDEVKRRCVMADLKKREPLWSDWARGEELHEDLPGGP